ncbi:MAG TPA: protein kinase [Candidatus Acidoferrales bacterium]|nr:protein kinase [Candidatus Acidoferrales bacterium]
MPESPERVGPYKILSKLGEGAMGVVYRAQDERLDRIVALKVIRGSQSDPTRRQRTWQEARAAAQVSHPNACRLYDIVEENDCLFLVMELLEGESLAARIHRGPIAAQEAAQIVLALLSALEAFHKAGVIHRDLKPANIFLSPHGTKVLDFGLAKHTPWEVLDPAAAPLTGVTATGAFLGTPRYASPEQFTGKPVDARSDIFSLGVIFFEMLTGQPPFAGESFAELAHSVLGAAPPALTGSPAVSAMSRIVHTALARGPKDRYQSAEIMAAELRGALAMEGIETQSRARPLRRIIVLPFRILRPSEEIEFLAFSLPEAITVSLAGLEDLVVRSSIVAAQYSHESLDLKKIASEADVDVVLTGALLNLGDKLRITTQLVEAPAGTLVWSHSSQATIRDLLELHDDLVRRVVESLLPTLGPRQHQALQQDRPANPAVYEIYLRANELSRHWESLPAAIEQYERCVSMDPSYALAWARLGRVRWLCDKYSVGSTEGLRAADEAFQAAFRLSPSLAPAHNYYTYLQVDQGRALDAMKRLLERARERRNDPELYAGLAHVCRYCGLLQPALAAHQEARRLDPQISTSVNQTYFMLGDYQRALETSAGVFGYAKSLALASLGRADEAISLLREGEQANPGRLAGLFLASLRALLEGKRAESLEASEEFFKATFRDPEGMFYIARQLSYLGEQAMALDLLSRSIHNGFFCYPAMVRDPWLDSLRGRTEFTELLRKAQQLHREAVSAFLTLGGSTLLGMQTDSY